MTDTSALSTHASALKERHNTEPLSPGHIPATPVEVPTRVDTKGKVFTERVRTDHVEVELWTTRGRVHGYVHVMPGHRVKDMLNNPNEQFVAVTEAALVLGEGTGGTREVGFIAINKQYIITVIPLDDRRPLHADEEYKAY